MEEIKGEDQVLQNETNTYLNGQVIESGDEKNYLLELIKDYGAKKLADAMDWDLDDFVFDILEEPADQELYEMMMEQLGAKRRG